MARREDDNMVYPVKPEFWKDMPGDLVHPVGDTPKKRDLPPSCFCGWTLGRLTVILLLLVVILVIFVLVAGVLLYFRYIPYKPRPEIPTEPCEEKKCAFGSVCVVDEVTKDPYCKCQGTCAAVFAPVCGSDGITYSSECQMRLASCTKQKRITKRHTGPCDVKDPCETKDCPFGARCEPSLDGRSAECVCPDKCASYGDNRGSSPVCGSDGKDYPSLCELRKAACQSMKELSVKYHGKCDPCEGVQCSSMQVCQLDENRNPICRCNGVCTEDFRPVCGSDGKTYSNECAMRVEACKARISLRIIYWGECQTNPCDSVTCSHGQVCDIDRYGIATCHCPGTCELVMRPVCGSDEVTYDNECEMKRMSCIKQRTIYVQYRGVCGAEGPCNGVKCNFGAICVVKGDQAICECPTCSSEFRPICGSDGISYNNECKLKQEACLQKKEISIAYEGLCNGCENQHCRFYSICESDGRGDAKCVCPQACVQVDAKVCGTNGVTYDNECELKVESCKRQQNITVAQRGACDLCLNVHCKFGAKCENGQCVCPTDCPDKSEPVCSKDGVTYTNECHMRKAACQTSKEIEAQFYGECEDLNGGGDGSGSYEECDEDTCRFGGICDYDAENNHKCVCIMNCRNAPRFAVCGTDGQVYPNDCEVALHSCRFQVDVKVQPFEACGALASLPCDGDPPLINPLTNTEYYCGDNPPYEECPPGSYCHQSPHGTFAKCCRDGIDYVIKSCSESQYGCCPDHKTAALGLAHAGCPSVCKCNKLGSHGETCDPVTRQCSCKPGVGGLRCDRCEPGFWGLPKISEGNSGCIPCGCSMFGSVRDDCEQMTGRCVCKPGVSGMKCNDCPENQVLGPNGCSEGDSSTPVPRNCDELQCLFGGKCEDHDGHAECICDAKCTQPAHNPVCGSDNQSYGSECQLRLFACRYQKDIVVRSLGRCPDPLPMDTTEPPFRRSTIRRTTDLAEYNSLSKSTRHLAHNNIPENLISTKPTNAAPLVKGIVGDICFRDRDCTVPFTRCRDGWCDCRDGYYPNPDRHQCHAQPLQAKATPETPTTVCSSQPCLNGGICHVEGRSGYRCICPPGIKGKYCEDVPNYDVPAFSGKSYLELKKLKAYSQVTIDIEFRSYANDGILVYNGQKPDGQGDFISLSIKNGFVEFRYNLGSGPVIIRSLHKVRMKKYHRVVAKRFHRDGMLRMDNQEDVAGRSQGMLKSLDLKQNLYVGYVPGDIAVVFDNIGVSVGLVGCVRKLRIGRKDINLKYPGTKDILKSIDVGECGENPCVSMPCQNGATCMAANKDQFKCMCLHGYTGKVCETVINPCSPSPCTHGATCVILPAAGHICMCPPGRKGKRCEELKPEMHEVFIPDFDGTSYIELPTLQNVGQSMSLEIWFLTRVPNGLLFYSGQSATGRGDYISLNLVDGHPQFRFDLGSGPANVTSSEPVSLGEWHSIKVSRYNRKGTMQIDNGPLIQGESGIPLNELNVEQPLYVGGFKSLQSMNAESGIQFGLNGAIQRIVVNGEVYDSIMEKVLATHRITKYDGFPCAQNPCVNGGICIPLLREFTCKCPLKFIGKTCEMIAADIDLNQPVAFNGTTFLKYLNKISQNFTTINDTINFDEVELTEVESDNFEENERNLEDDEKDTEEDEEMGQPGQAVNKFEIKFRTSEPNGLLLWMNKGSTLKGDYFVVAIVDGLVEFSYNLGKQKAFVALKSQQRVDDNMWHTVIVDRKKRLGHLQVDNETPTTGTSNPGATILNTKGVLWLGGSPGLPNGLPVPYYTGFTGCVETVRVDGEKLHLVTSGENNIKFCTDV